MKTKIKRHSRSVLSVILAVCLLVTSSVAVMLVSNAVIDPSEPIAASVVEEGVVGASNDDDSLLGDTTYGVRGSFKTDSGGGWSNIAFVGNVATVDIQQTGTYDFGFYSTAGDWYRLDQTFSSSVTDCNFGKSGNNCKLKVEVTGTYTFTFKSVDSGSLKADITFPAKPDVCTSISITPSKTELSTTAETFTLTADAVGQVSGDITYTFKNSSGDTVATVVSNNGSATTGDLTQSGARTMDYYVTASKTGNTSKTSATTTVTNTAVAATSKFAVSGLLSIGSAWQSTYSGTTYKINTSAGDNVFYTVVPLAKPQTTDANQENKFRLIDTSDNNFDPDSNKALNAATENKETATAYSDKYFYITYAESGNYRIYVDQTDASNPVVWVTEDNPICTSVTLSSDKTGVDDSTETFTLTATVTDAKEDDLTYTFYDENDESVAVITSSTGSASVTTTLDAASHTYRVVVSGSSSYGKKTSNTVKVYNYDLTEPVFAVSGLMSSGSWPTTYSGCTYKVNTPAGRNVFYTKATFSTATTSEVQANKFRLRRSGDDKAFSPDPSAAVNASTEAQVTGINKDSTYFYATNVSDSKTYRIYIDQTDVDNPKVWITEDRDIYITSGTSFYSYVNDGLVTADHKTAFETAATYQGYNSGSIYSSAAITADKPFMLSTTGSVEYDLEYDVRTDLCTGVTLTEEHVMVGHEEDGHYAWIYKIKSNVVNTDKYTKNIILHIDKKNKKIWATATIDQTAISDNTYDDHSTEKVRYYFAQQKDQDAGNYSDNLQNGVIIKYWNNSLKQSSYSGTVTMKTSDGSSGTYGYIGSIYVDLDETLGKVGSTGTYSSGDADTEFNLYYCDLPIWATTFQFRHHTVDKAIGSMCYALNPNRVYIMWGGNDPNVSAVVLDSSLSSSSTNKNFTDTQNFTANIVKLYNIDDTPSGEKTLDAVYRKDNTRNTLYFGNFANSSHSGKTTNLLNFKLWNNLAQRKDETKYDGCSYNAITWGLAGSVLNLADTATNPNAGQFYSIQDTDNNAILPFFDYKNALSTQVAEKVYTNTDFPFYKSTYDGITYYSYDSLADPNRQINNDHKTYSTSSFVKVGDFNGFAPFGSSDAYATASEFDINFYMTSTGSLVDSNKKSHDIVYNFSGDDDVWVYIDGVKVLDLGGDHMISAASINLTDMKVYYKTPAKDTSEITKTNEDYANSKGSIYTVDLDALFKAYGVTFSNTNAAVQHKLQMFYLERGEGESNFSASFNLPQNSGLRIQNEIDTSEVNNGLVDATLWAANHDYFQYYVSNSLANADQYNSAKSYYGLTNLHSAATGKAESSFYTDTPAFPVENTSTVNRVTQGITQLLLKNGISGGAASAAPTLASGATDFGLAGINYELTDAYTSGDIDSILSGTVRTIDGDPGVNFNLLYNQAAVFDSKITPNTWLVVKQQNELYLPTDNGSYITRGDDVATGVAPEDQRNASRFYTTTFTITDDAANKVINTRALANNMETAVVAHSADNEDGYYFANYSDKNDDSLSVAATYKFVNKPNTGTIKVTKEIDAGNETPDLMASFWFDVTFDNVFGVEDGDETFSPYNIKYKVYNTDGTYVERNYGTTNGIMLRHGQTAEITGIPSGTLYKVIERSRGGYNLDTVVKTSYRNGVQKKQTTMTDSQQYEKASDIDYMASTDVGAYLATFEFVNKKVAMKVVLHYYDRKMQNGVPVDIDTEATTATVAYQNAPSAAYEEYDNEHNLLWVDTEGYITNAVAGKLDNVVDKYSYWTTNSKAKAGIQTKKQISYTLVDGTYIRSLTNYSETAYHLDAYGKALSDPQDSDMWITYKSAKGADLTSSFTDEAITDKSGHAALYNQLAQIDVWVFNEPKEYTATVHGADDVGDLTAPVAGDDSIRVGTAGGVGSITDYYNTRFGEAAGDDTIDTASNIMKQYGRNTSFTGTYPSQVVPVERKIGDYHFVGWSLKADGSQIFTNDYYCGYRILSNMDLYPVYMKTPTTGFGLTILPNANDTYVAANGTQYTRLNVTYNPYNVTGDSDSNIKEIAMVNIRMADDFDVSQINLDTVREKVKEALDALPANSYGAHTITVTVTNNSGKDVTKPVRSEYNANELNYLVTFDTPADNTTVKLNNKNRVMLTQTYNSSLLAETKSCHKLLVLGAMKYDSDGSGSNEAEWTISNNYLYYVGGVCQ